MNKVLLGIDPGTRGNMGVSIWRMVEQEETLLAVRYYSINDIFRTIDRYIYDGCTLIVAIETQYLNPKNLKGLFRLAEVKGAIEYYARYKGAEVILVNPERVRQMLRLKRGTRRKEKKKAAVHLVKLLYGYDFTDREDLADAVLIGRWAIKEIQRKQEKQNANQARK